MRVVEPGAVGRHRVVFLVEELRERVVVGRRPDGVARELTRVCYARHPPTVVQDLAKQLPRCAVPNHNLVVSASRVDPAANLFHTHDTGLVLRQRRFDVVGRDLPHVYLANVVGAPHMRADADDARDPSSVVPQHGCTLTAGYVPNTNCVVIATAVKSAAVGTQCADVVSVPRKLPDECCVPSVPLKDFEVITASVDITAKFSHAVHPTRVLLHQEGLVENRARLEHLNVAVAVPRPDARAHGQHAPHSGTCVVCRRRCLARIPRARVARRDAAVFAPNVHTVSNDSRASDLGVEGNLSCELLPGGGDIRRPPRVLRPDGGNGTARATPRRRGSRAPSCVIMNLSGCARLCDRCSVERARKGSCVPVLPGGARSGCGCSRNQRRVEYQ
eukprot:PhM_4_TR19024/c0_g1_i1/m.8909